MDRIMDRIQLKDQARRYIRESKPSSVVAGIIFVAVLIVFSILSAKLVGIEIDRSVIEQFIYSGDIEMLQEYFLSQAPTPVEMLLSALLAILEIVLSAGFTIFILNIVSAVQASYWNLLDGFGMILRVLLLYILEKIFIFLWALLLIVPGIIAAYKYRLAIYLLIEHPEMSVMDCIRESKRLMRGYKGELFVLDLSFIGWAILSGIPYVGYIARAWLAPFYRTSEALFYKQRMSIEAARGFSPEL